MASVRPCSGWLLVCAVLVALLTAWALLLPYPRYVIQYGVRTEDEGSGPVASVYVNGSVYTKARVPFEVTLPLSLGTNRIEIRAEGYRTVVDQFCVDPDWGPDAYIPVVLERLKD